MHNACVLCMPPEVRGRGLSGCRRVPQSAKEGAWQTLRKAVRSWAEAPQPCRAVGSVRHDYQWWRAEQEGGASGAEQAERSKRSGAGPRCSKVRARKVGLNRPRRAPWTREGDRGHRLHPGSVAGAARTLLGCDAAASPASWPVTGQALCRGLCTRLAALRQLQKIVLVRDLLEALEVVSEGDALLRVRWHDSA